VKYKNFSEQRAKPKEARPLQEVSIAKVVLQAQDIFRGKSSTIIPSFFTATTYLTFVIFLVLHSVIQAVLLQLPHPL